MSNNKETGFEAYLAFAHRLADLSAAAVLPHFRNLSGVEDKSAGGAYDPVTAADRQAEQVIRAEIEANWPDHDVRGEEFGGASPGRDYCWLVDPIDGTRPF
ncbi:MAG TPA: histidinol-phosphatase, partial [Rhizobiales bacterium]|nr:histidinol-phosphatase [Hyphomicrobiales bacterium]